MKYIKIFAAAMLPLCGVASADTLYLTSGATVDGRVTSKGDGLYEVKIGEDIVVFYRADEVERMEENNRTGIPDPAEEEARWAKLEAELEQKTGLTAEQRQEVEPLLAELTREGGDRIEARKRLVALQEKFDVYKYLDFMLTEATPLLSMALLDAMYAINTPKTIEVLPQYLEHAYAGLRQQAISLLARAGATGSVPAIARGLADHELEVKIEAAYALGSLNARNATPALIELLAHPDLRVSNASRDALHLLWKNEVGEKRLATVDEWKEVWAKSEDARGDSIQLAKLQPLVPEGTHFVME